MLIRTPSSYPTESLLGYVLRLSEANGYDTPWHILHLAQIGPGQMRTATLPVEKLAPLVNKKAEALQQLAYCSPKTAAHSDKDFRLLGHHLGKSLRSSPLRLEHPAVCLECIKTDGFIDAFFDLSIVVACPSHGRTLVDTCSSCKAPLSWFRPDLQTCRCGAALQSASTQEVSPQLVELLRILKAKLHSTEASTLSLLQGLPVEQLFAMSLRSLLQLLPLFARFSTSACNDTLSIMECAASALARWPEGFHAYLANARRDPSAIGSKAFLKHYESLYGAFFRGRADDDRSWMRAEFVSYGVLYATDTIVDPRMLGDLPDARRCVSVGALSRQAGLDRRTLQKWAGMGLVHITHPNNPYVVDTKAVGIAIPAQRSEFFEMRKAAAYVGLPVSVLSTLKADGTLSPHLYRHRYGYLKSDLDALTERLCKLSPAMQPDEVFADEMISLSDIMRCQPFYDQTGKSQFIKAYLASEIISVGRTGETPADIYFRRTDVETFVRANRLQADGGARSLGDAARQLASDPTVMKMLIDRGFLDSVIVHKIPRITADSLARFSERYVSLAQLSARFQTSSKKLASVAMQADIALLSLQRADGVVVRFVEREKSEELIATFEANMNSRQRLCRNLHSPNAAPQSPKEYRA